MIFQRTKIFSGGQTGVDRAALDFALRYKIPCGGWCPKGRLAEDGPIPLTYPLLETTSGEYPERTEMNIVHSDGTLIITIKKYFDKGTILTSQKCDQYGKPCLMIDLDQPYLPQIENIKTWIGESGIQILNIAGPRESSLPGIYGKTLQFLLNLIL